MTQVAMTSFGETSSSDAFFTGKPMIGELGYTFLFRNYRADNGKWQTADPIALALKTPQPCQIADNGATALGYPDGFNNFAYCSNSAISRVDPDGLKWGNTDFVLYYYRLYGADWLDTDTMGLTGDIWSVINSTVIPRVESQIDSKIQGIVSAASGTSGSGNTTYSTSNSYSFGSVCYSLGDGAVSTYSNISYSWSQYAVGAEVFRGYTWNATVQISYSDIFMDPLDIGIELGRAYGYSHTWNSVARSGYGTIKME